MNRTPLLTSLLAGAFSLAAARADLIFADFNDVAAGSLNGKGGGTGWTGNWSGSAIASVAAGNLTSALYPLVQSGTAQHARGDNTTGLRQNYRIPTLALTGEIWFSYLASTSSSTTGAGLSFNAPTATPFDNPGSAFLQFLGTSLVYRFGDASDQTLAGQAALGTTSLVVGRMVLAGGGGADSIRLWLNPDLVATPDINQHVPVLDSSAFHFADSITTVGAILHNNGSTTGTYGRLDALRLSDGSGDPARAFMDVTGVVPEPSAGALLLVGLVLLRRRI